MSRIYNSFSKIPVLLFVAIGLSHSTHASQRIVGGSDVAAGDYPWMAAVADATVADTFDAFFCGGSLIDSEYVLTAAHCVTNFETGEAFDLQATPTDVVLGTTQLGNGSGQRLSVEKIASHPAYDIALLKLKTRTTVKPVSLLMPGDNSGDAGTTATIIGWGLTSENGFASKSLQQVKLPVIPSVACKRAYSESHDPESELCAGLTHGRKDSCQSDSGGPLFVTGQDGRQPVQAGVVSYGDGCARPGFPGVYARVSTVVDWIEAVKANGGNLPGNDGGGGSSGGSGSGSELTAKFKVECDDLKCSFDATRSTAGSLPIIDYVWVIGENNWKYGKKVNNSYRRAGTYRMTLYVIGEDGEIARGTRKFTVTESDNSGLVSRRWRGEVATDKRVALPTRKGISLAAGQLQVVMTHGNGQDFDLDIQMLNPTTSRWQTLRRAATANTREVIRVRPTRAGQYRFVVHARRGKGAFRIVARHP